MKKTLIILFFILNMSHLTKAQDVIGGELHVFWNINKFKTEIKLDLYRIASMGINKPTVNIDIIAYTPLNIISDTLITPNIRKSTYYNEVSLPFDWLLYSYTDSIPANMIANCDTMDGYLPIKILSLYDNMSPSNSDGEMPKCTDQLIHHQYQNGKVFHQFNCSDPEGDSLIYKLEPLLVNSPYYEKYFIPSANYIDIDSAGYFEWDSPQDTGIYILNLKVEDRGSSGQNWVHRITPVIITPSILSSSSALSYPNYLQVFPNPTKDQLNIQFDYHTPQNTQIQIFDMVGHLVHSEPMTQQREQLSIGHLASGMYVVRVVADGKVWTRRVIRN